MEEILASIRRIISEDHSDRTAAEAPAQAAPAEPLPAEEVQQPAQQYFEESVPESAPVEEAFEAAVEEPVQAAGPLIMGADGSRAERETSNPDEERLASIQTVFTGAPEDGPEDAFEADYSEEAAEPLFMAEEEAPVIEDQDVHLSEPQYHEPAVEPARPQVEQVAFANEVEDAVADELLSPSTQSRVTGMFGQLSQGAAVSESPEGQSLEGLVRDMLRPILHQWLDDNLPGIVERMVEREIKRVSRGN